MNAKDYALRRIADIRYDLEDKAKLKYLFAEKPLNKVQIYKLLKTGKVKLRKLEDINGDYTGANSYNLGTFYDFSSYDLRKQCQEKYEEACKKIKETIQRAQDELIIGDMKEAIKILETLRNYQV
jgi:hypothetical protein